MVSNSKYPKKIVSSPRQKPPMNHHLTYRPQPAHIPADSLRADPCDTCDPRRFPRDPRRHSPPAHPILNSSFLILNWSYTFSAKERDSETGLSYFGSRYYSSDLSIWLSVDPMSDKYPSLSPYVYCANNPIKLVDPNGEEIGDYYDLNGKWLGKDRKNDNLAYTATSVEKDESGYVISAQNKSLLPISNSELLDRATWVCGESGGSNEMITDRVQNIGDASKTLDASVAEYYAAAINNIANTSQGGFYEAIKIRMSRKGSDGNIIYTSSGYFTGQPDCGNSNSRAFAKARTSGAESLNNQTRFTNSIAAVIKSVSGGSDPTNGCRAWLGGADYAKPYVDHADKCKSKATVQFSFKSKGGYHTFYRN